MCLFGFLLCIHYIQDDPQYKQLEQRRVYETEKNKVHCRPPDFKMLTPPFFLYA